MSQALDSSSKKGLATKGRAKRGSSRLPSRQQKNGNSKKRGNSGTDEDEARARLLIKRIQNGNQQAFGGGFPRIL